MHEWVWGVRMFGLANGRSEAAPAGSQLGGPLQGGRQRPGHYLVHRAVPGLCLPHRPRPLLR
eukprot:11893443-Alexandrium_andersonii.AAC.1